MAGPLDRLRMWDARLQRAEPSPPLTVSDMKVLGVLVVLGFTSLGVGATVLVHHRWLQALAFVGTYVGLWPFLGRLVKRGEPRRYARRLFWLGSVPGRDLLWPLGKVLMGTVSRYWGRMLPPDEKLMAYETVGSLTEGSVWVVSDKALYVWPIAVRDGAEGWNISRYPFHAIRGVHQESVPGRRLIRRWIAISESDGEEPLIVGDLFPIQQRWRIGDLTRAGMLAATGEPPPGP